MPVSSPDINDRSSLGTSEKSVLQAKLTKLAVQIGYAGILVGFDISDLL